MYRPFLLLLALAAAVPVAAQTAPDTAAVPVAAPVANPAGEAGQALLTVGTHAAAIAGMVGLIIYDPESPLLPALFVLSPLATGGVACGAGALLDVPGSCRRALLGSYLGAAPALVVTALAFAAGGDLWTPLSVVGTAGFIVYLVGPPLLALEGYRGARLIPGLALARTPEGAAPVATLRVEF